MKLYTTKEKVENYLLNTIDGSFADQIERWIEAMTKQIDLICNRSIAPEFTDSEVAVEETYLYDGDGSNTLIIKDCCAISEVTVDGTPVTVYKYPANKSYALELKLNNAYFSKGFQNVAVTGVQAMHEEVPADIEFACTVLVAGIINNQKKLEKVGTTEKIGNYSITYREDAQKADYETAKATLKAYKRISI